MIVIGAMAVAAVGFGALRAGVLPAGIGIVATASPTPSPTPAPTPSPSSMATESSVPTPRPSPTGSTAPGVDVARVAELLAKLVSNPEDTASLMDLGDIYFAAQDYTTAGEFYDRVLAIDGQDVQALLARGAVDYNTGDSERAKTAWNKVVALDPKNVEAHYDLGFLALNQASPDFIAVKREWQMVIAIDPNSELAKTANQQLEGLRAASMLP